MIRAILAFLLTMAVSAQTAPQFEVASVKPAGANQPGGGLRSGSGRLTVSAETLKRCIMGAYSVGPHQIAGGPAWLDSDRFEIVAKAEQPEGDIVLMLMLRTLLEDRFKLVVHRETRTVPALVLEVAKGRPKLEKSESGAATTRNGRGLIDAKVITMDRFAQVLARQTELPVVDATGLKGAFNLKLEWNPTGAASDLRPSLSSALTEQLGLRLESRKRPMEIMVIDRAEKPSEN